MDSKLEEFRQNAVDLQAIGAGRTSGVRQGTLAGDDHALDEDGSCGRSDDETDGGGPRHRDKGADPRRACTENSSRRSIMPGPQSWAYVHVSEIPWENATKIGS